MSPHLHYTVTVMSITDHLSESSMLELGKLIETNEEKAIEVIRLYQMWFADSDEAPPTCESLS